MAARREPSYRVTAPEVQRARTQIGSAVEALRQARRILPAGHPALEDLDAALLAVRIAGDALGHPGP